MPSPNLLPISLPDTVHSLSEVSFHDQSPIIESHQTAPSELRSFDKLSVLPVPPSPARRTVRGGPEISSSIPSVDIDPPSPSVSLHRFGSLQRDSVGARGFSPLSASDGSLEKEASKRGGSGESDRASASLPTMRNIRQALSRIRRDSEPAHTSPIIPDRPQQESAGSHLSRSRSPPRGASPLRIFQQWSASFYRRNSRDDPFIPVDPFRFHSHFPCISRGYHEHLDATCQHCDCTCVTTQPCCLVGIFPSISCRPCLKQTVNFVTDALPRQVYLHILLRLPALYFRRVARIFEEAEVSRPDIQRMIDAWSDGTVVGMAPGEMPTAGLLVPNTGLDARGQAVVPMTSTLPFPEDWNPPAVSPALARFKHSWEAFIDSLLREWKTLNVVSALLLTAIITMLQIPTAADDPVARYSALMSLVAALMSLSYGCIYIVRFVTMRSMFKASKWAEEAQRTKTSILWNVWVLLAMPAIWMAWSMIFFIVCVLSFVWRTGASDDPPDPPGRKPLSPRAALGVRVAITALLALGIIYFAMIVKTLRRYGKGTGDGERGRMLRSEEGVNFPSTNRTATGVGGAGTFAGDLEAALDRRGRRRERRGAEDERTDIMENVTEKEEFGPGLTQVASRLPDSRC